MSVILFILGILVAAAGVVTIGFGIPINEFNLGTTLIVSGTIALSTGLVLIGLAAAVDQLAQLIKALGPRAGARPLQPQASDQPVVARAGAIPAQAAASGPPQAAAPFPAAAKAPTPAAAPRGPNFARGRGEDRAGDPAAVEGSNEGSSSAIERLRSSLRADRKTSETAHADDASHPPLGAPAPPASAGPLGTNGASAPAAGASEPGKKKPPLDFLFRSKAREQQPEPFDTVWPKRGARQNEEAGDAAKPASEAPKSEAPKSEAHKPTATDRPAGEEARSTAILKSGVVDGMAYTLYVDGSIEAQLPQGTVRFSSIAELRSHIENNS
jgi:hypothetical protein